MMQGLRTAPAPRQDRAARPRGARPETPASGRGPLDRDGGRPGRCPPVPQPVGLAAHVRMVQTAAAPESVAPFRTGFGDAIEAPR